MLSLFWHKEFNLEVCWITERVICCEVENGDKNKGWNLFASYGTPYPSEKEFFWEFIGNQVADCHLPWVVIGDLNEIVTANENRGGRNIWKNRLFLKQFMDNIGVIDLGFSGKRYTWGNNHEGFACIKERLGRAVVDKKWIEMFQTTFGEHFLTEE